MLNFDLGGREDTHGNPGVVPNVPGTMNPADVQLVTNDQYAAMYGQLMNSGMNYDQATAYIKQASQAPFGSPQSTWFEGAANQGSSSALNTEFPNSTFENIMQAAPAAVLGAGLGYGLLGPLLGGAGGAGVSAGTGATAADAASLVSPIDLGALGTGATDAALTGAGWVAPDALMASTGGALPGALSDTGYIGSALGAAPSTSVLPTAGDLGSLAGTPNLSGLAGATNLTSAPSLMGSVLGGAGKGAATGALSSAARGGNPLTGALTGALTGGVGGGVGNLAGGGFLGGTAGGAASGLTGSLLTGENPLQGVVMGAAGGAGAGAGNLVAPGVGGQVGGLLGSYAAGNLLSQGSGTPALGSTGSNMAATPIAGSTGMLGNLTSGAGNVLGSIFTPGNMTSALGTILGNNTNANAAQSFLNASQYNPFSFNTPWGNTSFSQNGGSATGAGPLGTMGNTLLGGGGPNTGAPDWNTNYGNMLGALRGQAAPGQNLQELNLLNNLQSSGNLGSTAGGYQQQGLQTALLGQDSGFKALAMQNANALSQANVQNQQTNFGLGGQFTNMANQGLLQQLLAGGQMGYMRSNANYGAFTPQLQQRNALGYGTAGLGNYLSSMLGNTSWSGLLGLNQPWSVPNPGASANVGFQSPDVPFSPAPMPGDTGYGTVLAPQGGTGVNSPDMSFLDPNFFNVG